MKPEKLNSGMNGIRTHELCDDNAVSVLYQNSCRQLIIFRVHQKPGVLEDEDMKVNDKNIHDIYFYFLSLYAFSTFPSIYFDFLSVISD